MFMKNVLHQDDDDDTIYYDTFCLFVQIIIQIDMFKWKFGFNLISKFEFFDFKFDILIFMFVSMTKMTIALYYMLVILFYDNNIMITMFLLFFLGNS